MLVAGAAFWVLGVCTAGANNSVEWQTLGNQVNADGKPYYVQRFTVKADEPFDRLAFCMFKRSMETVNPQDTLIEILPGYFAVASPRFASVAAGDTVVIDVITKGAMRNISYSPDGFHLVKDGKVVKVSANRLPITSFKQQWATTDGRDGMIYGPAAFEINDSLRSQLRPAPYMQIPTPKKVTLAGSRMIAKPVLVTAKADDPRHDYYRVDITGDTAVIYTNSTHPQAVKNMLQRRLDESADASGRVPAAVIEDWADLPYRGFMYDVARNFNDKESVKSVLSLMARYGLNVFHFHLGDDEAWRVEMPSLPELTQVGARRGYTMTDDAPFLKQIYSGDGDPNSTDTPANGFYSVADFIEILQYADSLGIKVIPEFDTPGHSRAAIRAMEHRYRTTGDASLRLIHDGDTSKYSSAQAYHDNTLNPALEGPYKFWGIVMDDVIKMYEQAGLEKSVIHIGGDEVPAHVWDGSDVAVKFMKEKGMTHQRDLHAYFVERVARLAADRGLKIAGWQEIALDHSPEYDAAVLPVVAAVNSWTNAGSKSSMMAGLGYPIILSNVDYLYFDQTPTTHPEEPGLIWGGLVDEFRPLHATVDNIFSKDKNLQSRVAGITGTIFAETVRSHGMIERYLLPRLLGLAERGHNTSATISDEEYFGALTGEMSRWAAEGREFYLRQPGIRLSNGKIEMNEPYGAGEIRYTLDGSQPTAQSTLYTGPFDPGTATQVKARLFYGPAWSVTSILDIK